MQGLESLNQFQNFMSSVGGLGRFEDTYMVHAAEGETPATATKANDIRRDVAIIVNKLDIFGEVKY